MTKPYWSRLMKRPEASAYCSMTTAEFERAVATGALPMAKRVAGVERWDRNEIDAVLDGAGDWRSQQPLYSGRHVA